MAEYSLKEEDVEPVIKFNALRVIKTYCFFSYNIDRQELELVYLISLIILCYYY